MRWEFSSVISYLVSFKRRCKFSVFLISADLATNNFNHQFNRTRTKYGETKEIFTCTFSLVLVQCVVNAVFAKISEFLVCPFDANIFGQNILVMQFQGVSRDTTPQKYYMMSATTYLTAMVSSNRALQYVNYPTQVIGKSCKPIPVMILSALYARKKYSIKKYCFILTIVAGVVLFVMKDTSSKVTEETNWFGYFLLVSCNLHKNYEKLNYIFDVLASYGWFDRRSSRQNERRA